MAERNRSTTAPSVFTEEQISLEFGTAYDQYKAWEGYDDDPIFSQTFRYISQWRITPSADREEASLKDDGVDNSIDEETRLPLPPHGLFRGAHVAMGSAGCDTMLAGACPVATEPSAAKASSRIEELIGIGVGYYNKGVNDSNKKCILSGWLQPVNNSTHDPIFVKLHDIDYVCFDRSKQHRGYWVQTFKERDIATTVGALYYLQQPCTIRPSINCCFLPSQDDMFLHHRAQLALAGNLIDACFALSNTKRFTDMTIQQVHAELSSSCPATERLDCDAPQDEPFDLDFLMKYKESVIPILLGIVPDLTATSLLIRSLGKLSNDTQAWTRCDILRACEVAEARSQQHPWGGKRTSSPTTLTTNQRVSPGITAALYCGFDDAQLIEDEIESELQSVSVQLEKTLCRSGVLLEEGRDKDKFLVESWTLQTDPPAGLQEGEGSVHHHSDTIKHDDIDEYKRLRKKRLRRNFSWSDWTGTKRPRWRDDDNQISDGDNEVWKSRNRTKNGITTSEAERTTETPCRSRSEVLMLGESSSHSRQEKRQGGPFSPKRFHAALLRLRDYLKPRPKKTDRHASWESFQAMRYALIDSTKAEELLEAVVKFDINNMALETAVIVVESFRASCILDVEDATKALFQVHLLEGGGDERTAATLVFEEWRKHSITLLTVAALEGKPTGNTTELQLLIATMNLIADCHIIKKQRQIRMLKENMQIDWEKGIAEACRLGKQLNNNALSIACSRAKKKIKRILSKPLSKKERQIKSAEAAQPLPEEPSAEDPVTRDELCKASESKLEVSSSSSPEGGEESKISAPSVCTHAEALSVPKSSEAPGAKRRKLAARSAADSSTASRSLVVCGVAERNDTVQPHLGPPEKAETTARLSNTNTEKSDSDSCDGSGSSVMLSASEHAQHELKGLATSKERTDTSSFSKSDILPVATSDSPSQGLRCEGKGQASSQPKECQCDNACERRNQKRDHSEIAESPNCCGIAENPDCSDTSLSAEPELDVCASTRSNLHSTAPVLDRATQVKADWDERQPEGQGDGRQSSDSEYGYGGPSPNDIKHSLKRSEELADLDSHSFKSDSQSTVPVFSTTVEPPSESREETGFAQDLQSTSNKPDESVDSCKKCQVAVDKGKMDNPRGNIICSSDRKSRQHEQSDRVLANDDGRNTTSAGSGPPTSTASQAKPQGKPLSTYADQVPVPPDLQNSDRPCLPRTDDAPGAHADYGPSGIEASTVTRGVDAFSRKEQCEERGSEAVSQRWGSNRNLKSSGWGSLPNSRQTSSATGSWRSWRPRQVSDQGGTNSKASASSGALWGSVSKPSLVSSWGAGPRREQHVVASKATSGSCSTWGTATQKVHVACWGDASSRRDGTMMAGWGSAAKKTDPVSSGVVSVGGDNPERNEEQKPLPTIKGTDEAGDCHPLDRRAAMNVRDEANESSNVWTSAPAARGQSPEMVEADLRSNDCQRRDLESEATTKLPENKAGGFGGRNTKVGQIMKSRSWGSEPPRDLKSASNDSRNRSGWGSRTHSQPCWSATRIPHSCAPPARPFRESHVVTNSSSTATVKLSVAKNETERSSNDAKALAVFTATVRGEREAGFPSRRNEDASVMGRSPGHQASGQKSINSDRCPPVDRTRTTTWGTSGWTSSGANGIRFRRYEEEGRHGNRREVESVPAAKARSSAGATASSENSWRRPTEHPPPSKAHMFSASSGPPPKIGYPEYGNNEERLRVRYEDKRRMRDELRPPKPTDNMTTGFRPPPPVLSSFASMGGRDRDDKRNPGNGGGITTAEASSSKLGFADHHSHSGGGWKGPGQRLAFHTSESTAERGLRGSWKPFDSGGNSGGFRVFHERGGTTWGAQR